MQKFDQNNLSFGGGALCQQCKANKNRFAGITGARVPAPAQAAKLKIEIKLCYKHPCLQFYTKKEIFAQEHFAHRK